MSQIADYKRDTEYAHDKDFILMKIMFPYIEAIASSVYDDPQPVKKFLSALGIKYPNLFWLMYRHGMLHDSYPAVFEYKEYTISWGTRRKTITMSKGYEYTHSEEGEIEEIEISDKSVTYSINVFLLHQKVLEFLKDPSIKAKGKGFKVRLDKYIQADIDKLVKNYTKE